MDLREFSDELAKDGVRCILQVRHAERPKMDPDDPTFGDALPITDEGVRTARELGARLSRFGGDVQFAASPLRRTRMTAELIADGMGVVAPEIPVDDLLGNRTFYYADAKEVLDVFKPENFFNACFEYFRTGEQRGFRNLYAASDDLEDWLVERLKRKLFVAVTHDCYIAAYLAAKGGIEFTRDNWPRFLDSAAIVLRPDGERRYMLVRAGLSPLACGV